MLGNGVVQLVGILHNQRLRAIGLEEQTALSNGGDKLEALQPRDIGVVDRLDL